MEEIIFDEVKTNGRFTPDELSNEEYHKTPGISASGIKSALDEPQVFLKKHLLMRLPSPALDIGTALHEALLEPESFNITKYDLQPAHEQKLKVMINNGFHFFDYILKNTANEHSFIMYDEVLETVRKIRVDAYDEVNGIIYDIKSTRYTTAREFMNDAYKLGYPLQASWYIDTLKLMGFKAQRFVFLCVPSVNPCTPFAVEMTQEVMEDGRGMYSEIVYEILDIKKRKDPRVKYIPFEMPEWRRRQVYGD